MTDHPMKLIPHGTRSDPDKSFGHGRSPLLTRIRAVLNGLDLDCRCRAKVGTALERFEILEARRELRSLILDARHQAERIGALLELVGELDTLTMEETDLSVFQEIALLFEDIKTAAARGAEDMITAGSVGQFGTD